MASLGTSAQAPANKPTLKKCKQTNSPQIRSFLWPQKDTAIDLLKHRCHKKGKRIERIKPDQDAKRTLPRPRPEADVTLTWISIGFHMHLTALPGAQRPAHIHTPHPLPTILYHSPSHLVAMNPLHMHRLARLPPVYPAVRRAPPQPDLGWTYRSPCGLPFPSSA